MELTGQGEIKETMTHLDSSADSVADDPWLSTSKKNVFLIQNSDTAEPKKASTSSPKKDRGSGLGGLE